MLLSGKTFTFDRTVRIIIGALVLIALFLLTKRLSSVLLPFLISWLIAYLIYPIVCFFQYKCRLRSRILSIVVTLVLIVGCLVGLVWVLAPMIVSEMTHTSEVIGQYINSIDPNSILPESVQQQIRQWIAGLDLQTVLQDERLMSAIQTLIPNLWNVLSSSLSFVVGLFVIVVCLLYIVFILLDYEKLTESLPGFIPQKYRSGVMGLLSDLESGMNSYFRAQALIAAIVGVLFAIGFSIIGMPLAIVMGLIIGVMNLVPYLQTVGLVPCIFLCILKSAETGQNVWMVLLELAVVVLIVQTLQDMVLTPRIMGSKMGLKPVAILFSLSVWGSLLGVVGMIIALPMTTLIISYYKRFILDEESDQPDEETPSADDVRTLDAQA